MQINKEIEDMKAALASLEAKATLSEPKLTQVSLESQAELAVALMEGRTFLTPMGSTLQYKETEGCAPFRVSCRRIDEDMISEWAMCADLQEINAKPEEEWYHRIPTEGVLCHVSDEPQDTMSLALDYMHRVYSYNYGALMPFVVTAPNSSNYIAWKYATPVPLFFNRRRSIVI